MFHKIIAPAALMAALMINPNLRAGDWVAVASACVPDEGSAGKYRTDLAKFEFAPGHTGTIDARCNVTNPQDSILAPDPYWNKLEVTYNDPDGSQINNRVKIIIRRVDKYTGAAQVIATFDSDTGTPGQQMKTMNLNHTFNFQNYGYYVGIAVTRSGGTYHPQVQRVRLFHQPTN